MSAEVDNEESIMRRMDDDIQWNPHAFHSHLPPHYIGEDGIPYITKFAHHKARMIVELARSLKLHDDMFVREDDENEDETTTDEEDEEDGDDDHAFLTDHSTLASVSRKCVRLQAMLTTLEGLKYGGISQEEWCEIVLHMLSLVTATVTYDNDTTNPRQAATLHYETVGYLWKAKGDDDDDDDEAYKKPKSLPELEQELSQHFALPEPAREALLTIAITILSKTGLLKNVSNAALYPDNNDKGNRVLLILHWRVLLRMLLRTAPYLDEHKTGSPPTCSNSRQTTIIRRTVRLIRHARHFFDQGMRPFTTTGTDLTSRELWNMVERDVLYQSHTQACYRGAIILYLFMPTRNTQDFYLQVLPQWLKAWSNIDRCPDYDYMWLVLFCRARKHVSPNNYDWSSVRKRLLTHCQYWLQIPSGGGSMDKSFPWAESPRSRSCPARLKAFVGSSSSFEEGMDFVAKIVQLLVVSVGTNSINGPPNDSTMSEGTLDLLRFWAFVAPYYNPSNTGGWTFTLGAFLHYFAYELSRRVAIWASLESLKSTNPALVSALCVAEPSMSFIEIPPHELVALLNALLPLCQQALYSKNGYVGRAGEAAMTYLAQVDPVHVTPSFLDFATNALDLSAVHLSHQAPSALSALARLVQPSLRRQPSILLQRLPQILRLSLAGIDSNDQNKSIRTLIFYRSLTSWVPIIREAKKWPVVTASTVSTSGNDGTITFGMDNMKHLAKVTSSKAYLDALEQLPSTSLLRQQHSDIQVGDPGVSEVLLEEVAAAMGDWVLAFLDRIYELLRATGEREKTGKTGSGVANRHLSSDVQEVRNFSRVMKECLIQIFAAMDDETHKVALRSVTQFLSEETLSSAAKDSAALCQAVAAARSLDNGVSSEHSPGLDALVPILLEHLSGSSSKTVIYRLRCLAGSVRYAGRSLVKHCDELAAAVRFALSSDDKDIFKSGCKLLRQLLSSLCEAYPISTEFLPKLVLDASPDGTCVYGKSATLKGKTVHWHVPTKEEVEFAYALLEEHAVERMNNICLAYSSEGFLSRQESQDEDSAMVHGEDRDQQQPEPVNIMQLRRCLRVVRYSLRGCAGLLLDKSEDPEAVGGSLIPHEQAVLRLLSSASRDTSESIMSVRGLLCSFVVSLLLAISSETADAPAAVTSRAGSASQEGQRQNGKAGLISSDTKVCKELSDITTMLLTRRSAPFRCQEWATIWNAQKQNEADVLISSLADHTASVLQRYSTCDDVLYKDGEDGGKTLSERLLITRLQIFYQSIARNASFEVPRRLRRLQGHAPRASTGQLFTKDLNLEASLTQLVQLVRTSTPPALQCYESLVDGLFSLCCHPNTQVRSSAIGVIDYAFTRFGWLVRSRVPRLLAAISLDDADMKGKYGIPSCAQLSDQVYLQQGKRKRLAEALKGVCSILAAPRAIREIMWSEERRASYVKTLCGTDKLISILPVEEIQKMVHYFGTIFSPFRSKFFALPRATKKDQLVHDNLLNFLLDILSDSVEDEAMKQSPAADEELLKASGENHWRKRLLTGWFVCNLVDEDGMELASTELHVRLWKVCFDLLENEMGQPLQRVAVGLFGRLVSFVSIQRVAGSDPKSEQVDLRQLREMLEKESFCRTFGQALVYDHRADTSIGGGHDAQWSAGVDDILRDCSRFVAPRALFPFSRTSQYSGTFKIPHAQLIQRVLRVSGSPCAQVAAMHLLAFAKEMAAAPPSEDQRNQQCTSAEIFAGVSPALVGLTADHDQESVWQTTLLPFLEYVVPKTPLSQVSVFFDAIRYAIQSSQSGAISPLVSYVVGKIIASLWRPTDDDNEQLDETAAGADGFSSQSKWLYLASAIAVEMGEESERVLTSPWFAECLQDGSVGLEANASAPNASDSLTVLRDELMPRLVASVGHPYENCRDHISGCLFRIWRSNDRSSLSEGNDPTSLVIDKFTSLDIKSGLPFKERYNSLITARKFMSYCTHLGDAQSEFSRLLIPLLPVAFEALQATIDEGSDQTEDDDAAKRTLEAEVVKGFRYTVAEVGSSCVMAYPNPENDISRVLQIVDDASKNEFWQVRHAAAHFLRVFQGSHKFLFTNEHSEAMTRIVSSLLSDERREVSSASMAALTGILAATPVDKVNALVTKYAAIANRSRQKKKMKNSESTGTLTDEELKAKEEKERKRVRNQQTSVFFLCAAILAQPYETPFYVPVALASISKHSFERSGPLTVRETVKKCCAEFKKTHMSDNWDIHKQVFTQEQLEALEDVVSSPHYYA